MASYYQKKTNDPEQTEQSGAYQSKWQGALDDTLDQILNRENFSYDVNADALYRQYRDSYTQLGRQAMQDTMGQAAALTGGYGNSYAQTAGQQAYNGYMQQLSGKIPELYALALEQYDREGDALYDRYALLNDQAEADADYNRWLTEFEESKRQYEQNLEYKKAQDAEEKALQAAKLLADARDYSLLAQYYGLTDAQIAALMGDNGRYAYVKDDEKDDAKDKPQAEEDTHRKIATFSPMQPIRPIAYGMTRI